jgi:hypothetical protein
MRNLKLRVIEGARQLFRDKFACWFCGDPNCEIFCVTNAVWQESGLPEAGLTDAHLSDRRAYSPAPSFCSMRQVIDAVGG